MVLLNIEVERTDSRNWIWKLVAAKNGKLVATSREYSSKQMCLKTAASLYEGILIRRLGLVERDKTCSSSSSEQDNHDGGGKNSKVVRALQERSYEETELED